ncbi:MAG TPA: P-II family nitrogen regulator [Gammaproteobacteria bacterium]|nr:P-II family nitrogen regulator [Gammaproteobacteria bacterium]
MKEIKAYVRGNMVDGVVTALGALEGVTGVAMVELRAFGHAASDGRLTMVDMVKLEVDVADRWADTAVDCIVRHARTGAGHPGDGRVFLSELADTVRISDGARGEDSL